MYAVAMPKESGEYIVEMKEGVPIQIIPTTSDSIRTFPHNLKPGQKFDEKLLVNITKGGTISMKDLIQDDSRRSDPGINADTKISKKAYNAKLLGLAAKHAEQTAKSIILNGGSESTAYETCIIAVESILMPRRSLFRFMQRRKVRRNSQIIAAMAVTAALEAALDGSSTIRSTLQDENSNCNGPPGADPAARFESATDPVARFAPKYIVSDTPVAENKTSSKGNKGNNNNANHVLSIPKGVLEEIETPNNAQLDPDNDVSRLSGFTTITYDNQNNEKASDRKRNSYDEGVNGKKASDRKRNNYDESVTLGDITQGDIMTQGANTTDIQGCGAMVERKGFYASEMIYRNVVTPRIGKVIVCDKHRRKNNQYSGDASTIMSGDTLPPLTPSGNCTFWACN